MVATLKGCHGYTPSSQFHDANLIPSAQFRILLLRRLRVPLPLAPRAAARAGWMDVGPPSGIARMGCCARVPGSRRSGQSAFGSRAGPRRWSGGPAPSRPGPEGTGLTLAGDVDLCRQTQKVVPQKSFCPTLRRVVGPKKAPRTRRRSKWVTPLEI